MITLNKKNYFCNQDDYQIKPHDEYFNLKIYPIVGELERHIGLLNDITEDYIEPNLLCFSRKYSSFIMNEAYTHFSEINIYNDFNNDDILRNIEEFGFSNKVRIVDMSMIPSTINKNTLIYIHDKEDIQDFLYRCINLDLPIILAPHDETIIEKYGVHYKLTNSDKYLYINPEFEQVFNNKFSYYMKDDLLDYDNLIHLCVMVKNGGDDFAEMLRRNLPIIDRWTILDTGSIDDTIENINKILVGKKKGKLYEEPFINFRESRNRCLELAGMNCKYNLMLDDTYVIEGELRDFLNIVRGDQFADSFSLLIQSNDTEYYSNRITISQYKLRYIYTIHEVIQGHNNINVVVPSYKSRILDLRSDYMEKRTMDRKRYDLKCLFEMIEEEPENPRHLYYIAQTYNLLEEPEKAAEWFYKRAFHQNEGFDQEKIDALFEMTRMYNFKLNRPWSECEKWYKLVHEWDPERPEASYFIGIHYYLEGDKKTAYEYLKRGFNIGFPIHRQYSLKPTLSYHFLPKFLAELSYLFNDYKLGQQACELFLAHNKPGDEGYNEVLDYYKIFLFTNNMPEIKTPATIPPRKILAFVADGGFKKWSGSSIIKEGVGGSETYIIEMARYIAKHSDYEVVVFCNCENEEIFEDVKYLHLEQYLYYISFMEIEHCIISRFSEYIMPAIKGHVKNIHLVVHDLTMSGNMIPVSNKLKNIFCLTEWHRRYFSEIFPQVSEITSSFHYGIDFTHFIYRNGDKKIPHSFIYSSFANRGLIVLLKMWHRILERYPDAILNIFADLNNKWANTNYPDEMAEIKRMMSNEFKDEPSIKLHGWVDKKTLGEYWRSSDIWFYPCKFKETFCLTALEAALSKTFAVTNNLAALEDTVGDRGIAIEGDVLTTEWQDRAFDAICKYIDSSEKNELIMKNFHWAITHSWEERAITLLEVINKGGNNNYKTVKVIDSELIRNPLIINDVGKFIGYKDDFITNTIINHGDWEPELNDIFNKYISSESTVIDIGAYIGTHTIKMAKKAKKVIAFEPFKRTYDILNANILINKVSNVEIYNEAIGNQNKKIDRMWFPRMDLTSVGLNMGALRINRHYGLINNNVIVDFDMRKLDDIISDDKIDLIKIDAEGCEKEVIEGAMNTIIKNSPVIVVENFENSVNELLKNLGYELVHKFNENEVYLYNKKKHYKVIHIGGFTGNTVNDTVFKNVDIDDNIIVVEPILKYFVKLKENYNKKYPNNKFIYINSPVNDGNKVMELFYPSEINDYKNLPWWIDQLASNNSEHCKNHGYDVILDSVRMRSITLDDIITKYHVGSLEWLVTDTEGHDYEILMALDLNKLKPKFIMFEHAHMDGYKKTDVKYNRLLEKFINNGYRVLFKHEMDTILELI